MGNDARITRDRAGRRWLVRWTDDVTGKRRSKSFADREQAEAFAAELRGPAPDVGQAPQIDADTRDWSGGLTWAANAILRAMAAEAADPKALRASARALSQLATAVHAHHAVGDLEEKLAAIKTHLDGRRQAAKYGTRLPAGPQRMMIGGQLMEGSPDGGWSPVTDPNDRSDNGRS